MQFPQLDSGKKWKSSCFLTPYTIVTKKTQESNTRRQDNKFYIFSSLDYKIVSYSMKISKT